MRGFEAATGINLDMTRKSSGETCAQVQAEAGNPKGDGWRGGPGGPHLQAAEQDLANTFLPGFIASMADFGNPLVLSGNFEVLSTDIFFAMVGPARPRPGRDPGDRAARLQPCRSPSATLLAGAQKPYRHHRQALSRLAPCAALPFPAR